MKLLVRVRLLRTSGAHSAFIHSAFDAKRPVPRKLRRTERTRVEAVSAADTFVFIVKHDTVGSDIKAIYRAHLLARGVGAVLAGYRSRYFLALYAVI